MVGQEDLKEYLEIDLEAPHVISVTESQGRFGNGQGVEFVEQYMLEYWRHNTWYTYKKWNGDKVRTLWLFLLLLLGSFLVLFGWKIIFSCALF